VRSQLQRVGHGGASALVRANTLASFDAAQRIGVDMVEFDVRVWRGDLVLAHTVLHARRGGSVAFRDALAHLSGARFDGIGVNVDLKRAGCEAIVLDELRRFRLLERTIICSQVPAVLDQIRRLAPDVRTGISIGGRAARLSQRWGDWRQQVLRGLTARRWDALMAHHGLIDAGLLADVEACGSQLYAWTVNHPNTIARLRSLGIHGIVTADPRLFSS
jgi:glycerophosphoryl diester phosphodiesterase